MYFIYIGKGWWLQASGESHGKWKVQVSEICVLPTAGSWIIQFRATPALPVGQKASKALVG